METAKPQSTNQRLKPRLMAMRSRLLTWRPKTLCLCLRSKNSKKLSTIRCTRPRKKNKIWWMIFDAKKQSLSSFCCRLWHFKIALGVDADITAGLIQHFQNDDQ